MLQAEIQQHLVKFVVEELLNGELIETDENLLSDGAVNSLGMMRLVAFVEDELAVTIPPEHLIIENFRTIDAISAYVTGRLDSAV